MSAKSDGANVALSSSMWQLATSSFSTLDRLTQTCRLFLFSLTVILTIAPWAIAQQPRVGNKLMITTTNGRTFEGTFSGESNEQEWMLVNFDDGLSAVTMIPVGNILRFSDPGAPGETSFESIEYYPAPKTDSPTVRVVRPQWIETTAQIRNTDNDSQPDGIELRVIGFSRSGVPVPLTGTIDVRLEGLSQKRIDTPPTVRQVDRWTRKIKIQHQQGNEVVLYLPFHGHPSCDWRLFDWTKVEVRLNTPGEGAWDAEADVLLRSYGPFQEQRLIQRDRWSAGYTRRLP